MFSDKLKAIPRILFANVTLSASSDSLMVLGMQIPIPLTVCLALEQDEIHRKRLECVFNPLQGKY